MTRILTDLIFKEYEKVFILHRSDECDDRHEYVAGCSSNDNPVKAGKYADFLLVNKDVLSCPVTEIHEAKPAATYFEG